MAKTNKSQEQRLFQVKFPAEVWERYVEVVMRARSRSMSATQAYVNLILLGINPPDGEVVTQDDIDFFQGKSKKIN